MSHVTPPIAAAVPARTPGRYVQVPQKAENIEFAALVRLFNRRKHVVAGITIAFTVFMLLLAFTLPPRYYGEANVMLLTRQKNVMNLDQVLSGLTADTASIRSEIEIISSRTMVNRVVDKLGLMKDSAYNRALGNNALSPFTWLQFIKTKAPPDAFSDEARIAVVSEVESRLEVSNDGRSLAIKIGFKGNTPQQAALTANTFADLYLVDQLETKFEATERANKWLSDRLAVLRDQVQAGENAVADFKKKNSLTEFSGATMTTAQASQISTQLIEARTLRAQAEARLRGAQGMVKSRGNVESSTDVLSSQLIQRLREQESTVRAGLAEMTNRYGERHPLIINKKEELRSVQGKIGEEVSKIVNGLENEVEIARAKERSLESELQRLQDQADKGGEAEVTLKQLQREADASRVLYETFLSRFKQVSEQHNMQEADARIIARAEAPLKTSFPNKLLFLIIGIMGGMAVGIMAAFIIEYFDRGFRGMPQIEEILGLTALGLVPALKGVTDRTPEDYILEKPLSSFSESLRTIRTGIHFSNVDQPPKIVMFTSALPSEGKSTVSMALARSLAITGNKIIVVECDLRRPRLRKALGGDPKKGDISHLLSGQRTFGEVVEKDKATGLDYLPAGSKVPNPQDLLGSHQMEKLLRFCAEHYDLVIVDTPPVLAVSDAAMIARIADTTVFVLRWGQTPRDVAIQAVKLLRNYTDRIAGAIMTQVDLEAHVKYGYGDMGYYYGHYREYYHN